MDFPDKWAAIVWICRNQLGRRNLTDEQRTYLIGKQYEAQKMTQGTNNQYVQSKSEKDQNDLFHFKSTAEKVAHEIGVSEPTVKRSEHFANGLDAAESVAPGPCLLGAYTPGMSGACMGFSETHTKPIRPPKNPYKTHTDRGKQNKTRYNNLRKNRANIF